MKDKRLSKDETEIQGKNNVGRLRLTQEEQVLQAPGNVVYIEKR